MFIFFCNYLIRSRIIKNSNRSLRIGFRTIFSSISYTSLTQLLIQMFSRFNSRFSSEFQNIQLFLQSVIRFPQFRYKVNNRQTSEKLPQMRKFCHMMSDDIKQQCLIRDVYLETIAYNSLHVCFIIQYLQQITKHFIFPLRHQLR